MSVSTAYSSWTIISWVAHHTNELKCATFFPEQRDPERRETGLPEMCVELPVGST